MILTGAAVAEAVGQGDIVIIPFDSSDLNPNSYNFHLFGSLLTLKQAADVGTVTAIPPEGYVLNPRILYLGATAEHIGSRKYAMTLLGRSSVGRLGLFLTATADLGHQGATSRWTLELSVVQPLRIYPGMRIGQVAFWKTSGRAILYRGRYQGDQQPTTTRDRRLLGFE